MTRLELLQQCEAFIRGFEGDEMQCDAPVESMLEGLRAEIKVEQGVNHLKLIAQMVVSLGGRHRLHQGPRRSISPNPARAAGRPRGAAMSAQADVYAAKFGDWWNITPETEKGTEWLYEHGPTDDYGFPQVNQSKPIELLSGDAQEMIEEMRADGLTIQTRDMAR